MMWRSWGAWLVAAFLLVAVLVVVVLVIIEPTTAAPPAKELTQQQRDTVEDAMAPDLVLPETAQYRFDAPKPYLGSSILVCGDVNYQSAGRVYTGFHNFYAILDDGRVTLSQIYTPEEDASGKLHYKIKLLCGRG